MSLQICSLNSGSNGNCYYIGNENEAVLVDVGISCREVEKRMKRVGLNILNVKAIFISHEHSDHIKGLVVLARKYQISVYITPKTLKNSVVSLEKELVKSFDNHEPITIGNLNVIPFSKLHDAIDPYSFIIEGKQVKIGVLTDIGSACDNVVHYFKQCHAVFLEANYDEEMLESGKYPYYLKKRISSDVGHLSNKQALELFVKHRNKRLSHLFLSHLSKENNSPEIAEQLFLEQAGSTRVFIASRHSESEIYTISHNEKRNSINPKKPFIKQLQMEFL